MEECSKILPFRFFFADEFFICIDLILWLLARCVFLNVFILNLFVGKFS